jgi:hypothetical protein
MKRNRPGPHPSAESVDELEPDAADEHVAAPAHAHAQLRVEWRLPATARVGLKLGRNHRRLGRHRSDCERTWTAQAGKTGP